MQSILTSIIASLWRPPLDAERNTALTTPAAGASDSGQPSKKAPLSLPGFAGIDSTGALGRTVLARATAFVWDQISKQRTLELAKLGLGKGSALGLKAFQKVFDPGDPAIISDPQRRAHMEAHPDTKVWVRTGGILDLGSSFGLPGGPLKIGFSATGAVQFSLLAPYAVSPGAVGDLARDLALELPLSSSAAIAMKQGEELCINGHGTTGASASISASPLAIRAPGLGALTSAASAKSSSTTSGEIAVNVKRLEGNRVYVRLSQLERRSKNAGAHAGGESVAGLAKLGRGAILSYLSGKASAELSKTLREVMATHVAIGATSTFDVKDLGTYVLDLATPEGGAAYEALLRLDSGPARALALSGQAEANNYVDDITEHGTKVSATFGSRQLLQLSAAHSRRCRRLEVSGNTLELDESKYAKTEQGPFSGRRVIEWQGISWKRNEEIMDTFFRLRFEKRDPATRQSEVQRLLDLASILGCELVRSRADAPENDLVERLLNGDYGRSALGFDVYFTREGLKRISGSSEADVLAAYATVAEKTDGSGSAPAWSVFETAIDAQKLMRRWENTGPVLGLASRASTAEEYRQSFGRDIGLDLEHWEEANALARAVAEMEAGPEEEWGATFTALGESEQFAFHRHLAALVKLAGTKEVLVHLLSLSGEHLDIAARDEGFVPSIEDDIGAVMGPI